MKSSAVRIAENILFVLNVFIIFLLLFGNRVVVPAWLQPVGRMHPMLLHFPIVILLLALLLEFFSFRMKYTSEKFYQLFADSLLLIGTLTAAITAIMGILLSMEEGYQGSVIQWHKIGGVSIVFVCSFIYYSRDSAWFKSWVAKLSTVVAVVCLITAAHLGATLTHGENFLLAPVNPDEDKPVPIHEALVFKDVIRPVLAQKCISCHNEKKIKGNLMLTDSAAIVRGGKSGLLFKAGDPEVSLMFERIHLPLEEKKHMPPSGKPQLTDEELNLLYHWIKLGPVFDKKVVDLPYKDSLRLAAARMLLQEGQIGEQFEFEAADEDMVMKLNNNYRLVRPIAIESPALAVTLFNRSAYNLNSLQELLPVKLQVISLDLNKLPVVDEHLKIISQFKNLRRLNLNFTDITGDGLNQLATLQHLRSLSVAGTKADAASLKKIASLKDISTLVVWNTGLSEKEEQQLKSINPAMDLVVGYKDDGKDSVRLNAPLFKNIKDPGSEIFIDKSLVLHLEHPVKGVDIRYSTSGKDPDSSSSSRFTKDTILTQNTRIRARAFKEGWLGSGVAKFEFYKSSLEADTVYLLSKPDEAYMGVGVATFTNRIAGDFNFYTDKWIGFRHQDLQLMYEFRQPVNVSSVGLHVLMMPKAEVFPPASIEVWGGDVMNNLKLIGMVRPSQPGKKDKDSLVLIESTLKPSKVSYLKIVAKPLSTFPSWIKTKNKNPWLFVDEIFLN
jgi:uncharacterized membrane protein